MTAKTKPEELVVEAAPPDADPCWCCHYKDNATGRCSHEQDCELLNSDLNESGEDLGHNDHDQN